MSMAKRMVARRAYCTFPYDYCDIPMDKAYPCAAQKRSAPAASTVSGQRLSNGTRVVTQDQGQATSLVSLYVDAGAVYESPEKAGVADFLSKMVFRSNLQSSDFHVYKTFQHAGANYWSNQVNSTLIGAKVECRRDVVPDVMRRLVESAFIPRFPTHEMKLEREVLDNQVATQKLDPKKMVTDLFTKFAFYGSSLANSDQCPDYNVDSLTHDDLIQHWSTYYVPKRVILAGVNVSQEELVAAYNKAEWSSANTDEHPSHKEATPALSVGETDLYVGGQDSVFFRRSETFVRQQFYDDVYVAYGRKGLGFQNTGDLATQLVAAGSIGGAIGDGFGFEGLVRAFPKNSAVGGLVRVRPDAADGAVRCMAAAVNSVGALSGAKLEDAKKVAAVTFLKSISTREGLVDFLALHSSADGVGKTPEDVLAAIAKVSEADLKKLHEVMQSADPTYVSVGDLKQVPNVKAL
eukprot:TRINITY_DN10835_c0_g2_i1.p1 TRINITY_DN10835_c0_g2~~TRINITY_DN10835_c0_g2_i1.p1  ORF type:complete len:463 (+),score=191.23 TRINITY_DN10835_c0_g2_i1:62-1450(+)